MGHGGPRPDGGRRFGDALARAQNLAGGLLQLVEVLRFQRDVAHVVGPAEEEVLLGAEAVVGEHLVLHLGPEAGNVVRDGLHGLHIVVEAGNYGRAHKDWQLGVFPGQGLEVDQDALVGASRELLVHGGIHVLDVEEHVVEPLAGFEHGVGLGLAAGLDGGAHVAGPGFAQERQGELGLEEGLAAGEGHAAAGARVEGRVLLDDLQHLVHGAGLAVDEQALGRAGLGAGKGAAGALGSVDDKLAFGQGLEGAPGTGVNAARAVLEAYAAVGVDGQLGLQTLGLGVAAPAAAQPAALEEDDGAYAGAVVDGVLLDVEDEAFGLLVVESAHACSLIA